MTAIRHLSLILSTYLHSETNHLSPLGAFAGTRNEQTDQSYSCILALFITSLLRPRPILYSRLTLPQAVENYGQEYTANRPAVSIRIGKRVQFCMYWSYAAGCLNKKILLQITHNQHKRPRSQGILPKLFFLNQMRIERFSAGLQVYMYNRTDLTNCLRRVESSGRWAEEQSKAERQRRPANLGYQTVIRFIKQ